MTRKKYTCIECGNDYRKRPTCLLCDGKGYTEHDNDLPLWEGDPYSDEQP